MTGDRVAEHNLQARRFIGSSGRYGTWLVLGVLALAIALIPLPTLVLLLGAGLALALPLIDPVFGLYWAVLSVPVQELVLLPGGLSYTQAAMLLATGAWGLRVLAHPERPIVWGRLFPLWVALLWALLLSTSFTPYARIASIKETLRWGEAFLVWLIAINTLRRRWQIAGLVACLLIAPAVDALIGLMQFLTGDGPAAFRIAPGLPYVRAYGTIGQPNSFAGYLNMAWPLALALAIGTAVAGRTKNRAQRTAMALLAACSLFFVLCSLLLAALAASFSRGAWLGAAIGLAGMVLVQGRRAARWLMVGLGVGALVVALGGAGLLPEALAGRLASIARNLALFDAGTARVTPENFAVVERMAQLQAGWRMFLAYPLTGVGPGNYSAAYPDFAVLPWYASRGHAHNYYLHMAAEAGIGGALAYLALLGGTSYQAIGTVRRANGTIRRSVAVGCCGIIAAVAGHELFENLHALSMGIQLAAVWGLIHALGQAEPADGARV
jgi:O-antigen ligase